MTSYAIPRTLKIYNGIVLTMLITLWTIPLSSASSNFMSLKHIDISKIPERYWIDNFVGCELQVKGWLFAARCKGDRIYIADLQSWADEEVYAPQVYWKRQKSGVLDFNLQPVLQFEPKTEQLVWIDIDSYR